MPGAAMSSFPMMVTCAERLVGDATVMTQPMSIATSKPSKSTKKSRVSAGRFDLMFGTALLIVTPQLYRRRGSGGKGRVELGSRDFVPCAASVTGDGNH